MRIAPRLFSGQKRIPGYSGLPPELREMIDKLARKEKCSRSWIIEQIILDWAKIKVEYKAPSVSKDIEAEAKQKLREKERSKYAIYQE